MRELRCVSATPNECVLATQPQNLEAGGDGPLAAEERLARLRLFLPDPGAEIPFDVQLARRVELTTVSVGAGRGEDPPPHPVHAMGRRAAGRHAGGRRRAVASRQAP